MHIYSVKAYGEMIADEGRTDAYARAIRQKVKPGSVVLDIGTGTGIFALLACQAGARRVYAVEPGNAIEVARQIAAANGFADRIQFIQGVSSGVSLPEPVDVVVSDLRGVLPYYQKHIPTIADARSRFLAPGGVLIPRADTLWLACVDASGSYRQLVMPWVDNKYGLEMSAAHDLLVNQWHRTLFKREELMTRPKLFATLDYSSIVNTGFDAEVNLEVDRTGVAHGLAVWFDSELTEDVQFSNSPEKPGLIYENAFFPWPSPVSLDAGDAIRVKIDCTLVGEEYVWRWGSQIRRQRRSDKSDLDFNQSDFFGMPISLGELQKRSADFVATLGEDGLVDGLVLSSMADGKSLATIAKELTSRFPQRFSRWQDALPRVGELSVRYSR